MTIKECIEFAITAGNYNAEEMENKINRLWVEGKLTEEERDALIVSCNENAQDAEQIDLVAKLTELENRVFALEHPEEPTFPVWVSGYVTQKGETVQYDYDADGNMDLLRYDGGRTETALRPGKIDGWHVVNAQGDILGTFYNGEFTPVQ